MMNIINVFKLLQQQFQIFQIQMFGKTLVGSMVKMKTTEEYGITLTAMQKIVL